MSYDSPMAEALQEVVGRVFGNFVESGLMQSAFGRDVVLQQVCGDVQVILEVKGRFADFAIYAARGFVGGDF